MSGIKISQYSLKAADALQQAAYEYVSLKELESKSRLMGLSVTFGLLETGLHLLKHLVHSIELVVSSLLKLLGATLGRALNEALKICSKKPAQ